MNVKNKKILIFGSSGFLGQHLVSLLKEDNEIIQFDINPLEDRMSDSNFIQGSILDKGLVLTATKGVDIVYHFAAMTDLDIVNNNPAKAIEVNIAGTSNILDACMKENVERFIFSSSVYVYSQSGGVYKSTKQACELLIEDYDKMHGLNYTILQLGSVYGPGATQTNLISRLIFEALTQSEIQHYGTGEEIRHYLFVKDVVNVAKDLMNVKFNKRKIILMGNERKTISQLMDEIISQTDLNSQKVFKENDYDIHYKTSPFHTKPNGAIDYNIESPTSISMGLKETILFLQSELAKQG
ncbi:MAG: NAD(P)-dependent oxidoreductase [Candidatus Marinimicrobia bacterium]|nr:NAD(P)-dependent oxidoreductase [Candidatus Neomarinimicrobiota bacterium]